MVETASSVASKSGLPPGSLVHIGNVHEEDTRISVVKYSDDHVHEQAIDSIADLTAIADHDAVTWINIDGLKNVALIESIGLHFNIHPLVLEDILNTHQRPKIEQYDGYLYFVLKDLSLAQDHFSVRHAQVSVLLLDGYVITFNEKEGAGFELLKRRIENNQGRLRRMGTDYLAYAVLDVIVDSYFKLQDRLDEIVESVEDELLNHPGTQTLAKIQRIKRELIYVRRAVAPLREMLNAVLRSDSPLIQDATQIYFRDINDHVLRITETMDSYREMATALLEIYISSVSNKTNEIMKVLTVFASIFIPLTFIAGIYGMNFEYMPELKWRWAYPTLWVAFITIPIIFLVYFKKKKWL